MPGTLEELLIPGQSPYFAMHTAGCRGWTLEEVTTHCMAYGIPLRTKDIKAWEDGWFKYQMRQSDKAHRNEPGYAINLVKLIKKRTDANLPKPFDFMKLEDFPKFPEGWTGTERRFFPCSADNIPLCPWGWKDNFDPNLMLKADAKTLSPVGWVGQNMLYQKFIVLDIDGVGHGGIDPEVIEFGSMFRNNTLCLENPRKPGSFHLYFNTDRIIPVKHFPWAKLDLMGNAVNAAVYFKDKVSNGLETATLTPAIWNAMMEYQKSRKGNRYES